MITTKVKGINQSLSATILTVKVVYCGNAVTKRVAAEMFDD
jgi:hypothetical protein